jgi:hypothetical protein
LAKGPNEGAEEGHVERRAHAFVAHVGDDKAGIPRIHQREGIVEIAAHFPRRLEVSGHLPARHPREGIGQKAELDLTGDLEVAQRYKILRHIVQARA